MKKQRKIQLFVSAISSIALGLSVTSFFSSGTPKSEAWQSTDTPFYLNDVGDFYDNGELNWARDIAIDSAGNVYIADQGNYRVAKFDVNGNFIENWGSYGTADGQFYAPRSVTVDSSDNVYVTDTGLSRIQKFDSNGNFILKWGSSGSGDGQFNNPTSAEGFRIEIDSLDNLYVTDSLNHRVQKFDSSGNHLLNFTDPTLNISAIGVGVDNATGNVIISEGLSIHIFNSVGVQTTEWLASLSLDIRDLDVKNTGNILVPSISNVIYEYTQAGALVNAYPGISTGITNGELWAPHGIFLDSSDNIFISEYGNHRYQEFDSSGNYIKKGGKDFTQQYTFARPIDTVFDSHGNYFVIDYLLNRVTKYNALGIQLTTIGIGGVGKIGGSSGDGEFDSPEGIGVDGDDNIYVADAGNNRIQKFDNSGNFLMKFGVNGSGNGQFEYPTDVVVDSEGYIYVDDTWNYRVQKFDSSGNYIAQWGDEGSGDGQTEGAEHLTINDNDIIYLSDSYNDRIQIFDTDGTFLGKFGTTGTGNGQFQYTVNISMASGGDVMVVDHDNNRIQRFDANGNYKAQITSPADRDDEHFDRPYGVAYDTISGLMIISDYNNNRIHRYKYDVIPPGITPTSALVNPTSGNTRTISGTATDTMTNVTAVQFKMDDTGTWTDCAAGDGAYDELSEDFSCTYNDVLTAGSHAFYIKATDSRTNTFESYLYPFTVPSSEEDDNTIIDRIIDKIEDIIDEGQITNEEDIDTADETDNNAEYDGQKSDDNITLGGLTRDIIKIHNTVAPITLTAAVALLASTALIAYPYSTIYYGIEWLANLGKKKAYGLVYDARDKKPVPFAIVELFKGNELVKRTVTNNQGKFILVVDKDKYEIRIKQTAYKEYSEELVVGENEHSIVETFGIFKLEDDFSTNVNRARKSLKEFAPKLFWIGLTWSIIALLLSFTVFNSIIVAIYLFQLIFLILNKSPRNWGLVFDIDERWKLPGIFVQAYDPETDQAIDTQITDKYGRFGFVLDGPVYELFINSDDYELARNNKTVTRGNQKFIKYKTGTNQIDKIGLKKKH